MNRAVMTLTALAALAACATPAPKPGEAAVVVDQKARADIGRQDMLTQMTFWAQEVQAHPDDLEAVAHFVEALRKGGRASRAVEVAEEALPRLGAEPSLLRGYGLALVSIGRGGDALRPLAAAASANMQDWRVRSALGVALDQAGRPEEARAVYREALSIKPDDVNLLTNLGVSFLMTGDSADAETILRQAAALPGASPETRINLAVAIALQGRFDEAERLQRVDLPAQMVAENMTYLRALITSPNRWQELGGDLGGDAQNAREVVSPLQDTGLRGLN